MTDALEREDVRPDPRTPAHASPHHHSSAHRTGGFRAAVAASSPSDWVVRCALPAALALWMLALSRTDLSRMGDLGLLQALPQAYFAALVLLTVGFVTALRAPRVRHRWPAAYVLALIAVVHATPSLLYPTLRYAWAWKHVAIVDAMLRHGGTVPGAGKLDVYNQWPGFFELHAVILRATGLDSVLGYAAWYPVITNVLLLGPLLLLYRSITTDRRLVWGGIWLYYATAWVGQDYFSPQAFAYLLSLTVVALVVRRLAVERSPAATGRRPAPQPPGPSGSRAMSAVAEAPRHGGWRAAPFALVLVLIAAIVSSHQLTPIMLAVAMALLALGRRNRRTVLPVLAAVVGLTVLWDATVARPFVSSHLTSLVTALGSPDHNAVAGLAQLGQAAPGQVLTSWADRCLTATVFLLAVAALIRHRWVRRVGLVPLLVAPLVLLLANAYDGEMLFRAYLFALPAAAFLVATLLWGRAQADSTGTRTAPPAAPAAAPAALSRSTDPPCLAPSVTPGDRPLGAVRTGVTGVVLLGLLTGLLFGYFGKESMNYFTPQEAAALRYVAATPPGSRVISLTANEPGGELHYDDHERIVLGDASGEDLKHLVADPGVVLQTALERPNFFGPTYLILTRAQLAECELTGLLPVSATQGLAAAAATASDLRLVLSNKDAVVYQYVPPPYVPGPQAPDAHVPSGGVSAADRSEGGTS
ncbi:glycosyltransferase [Kitasatospora sp. NPDC097691]|uniref:glycosyltransferase n=1 Tax=Kitasatospora sp. NPDC097691 TaxID=3157231 RepID=UPI003323AEA7